MEKEISELNREIERLNTIDSIRRKSIKTLESSNKKLTTDQANLIEKCEKYQKQYSKEKSIRMNIERSQDTVTHQINASQSELKKSKRVICDLVKQNNELTSENKKMTKLVDTQDDMINNLRGETTDQKDKIGKLERQMTELGAKLASIEKESLETKAALEIGFEVADNDDHVPIQLVKAIYDLYDEKNALLQKCRQKHC